jgi:hypothetical protein
LGLLQFHINFIFLSFFFYFCEEWH